MNRLIFFVTLFLQIYTVGAQDLSFLLQEGNKALSSKKYDAAISAYNNIIKEEKVSSSVYYNLANAYLGNNNIAQAIIYYERALKLDPLDRDIMNNLEIAKGKITDPIYAIEPFFISKYWHKFTSLLSFKLWTILSILLFIGAIISLYFFLLGNTDKQNTLGRKCVIVATAIFFLTLLICVSRYMQLRSDDFAVVMENTNRYEGPDERSISEESELSEGIKVRILDSYQEWIQVSLPDLSQTWIEAKVVEKI